MADSPADPVAAWLAEAKKDIARQDALVARMAVASVDVIEAVLALTRDTDGNDLPGSAQVPVGEFQAAIADALLGGQDG